MASPLTSPNGWACYLSLRSSRNFYLCSIPLGWVNTTDSTIQEYNYWLESAIYNSSLFTVRDKLFLSTLDNYHLFQSMVRYERMFLAVSGKWYITSHRSCLWLAVSALELTLNDWFRVFGKDRAVDEKRGAPGENDYNIIDYEYKFKGHSAFLSRIYSNVAMIRKRPVSECPWTLRK